MNGMGRLVRGVGTEFWFVAIIVVCLGLNVWALTAYLPHAMTAAALEAAHRANVEVADQIKITRGYYTKHVVAKALDTNALTPSYTHLNEPYEIPLPATFVQDISDLLKAKDTSLALVSPYPWPHRAGRKMDDFQQRAWDEFQRDPSAVFSRQEVKNGARVLRVAVADRMTGPTCVSCHNSHPESVKTDWKLGDVRAVMEVSKVIEPYLASAESRSTMIGWSIAVPAAIIAMVLIGGAVLAARYNLQKQAADNHVRYLAQHDAMTGLLNRAHFIASLSEMLRDHPDRVVAVHYVDLDGFKEVNDRLGHGVGDLLLKAVAERLRSVTAGTCQVCRLGGDEFAIGCEWRETVCDSLAGKIVGVLARPFDLPNHQINISASVGFALSSASENTAERLLEAADLALYKAKSQGRNRFAEYAGSMRDEVLHRRAVEQRVRSAFASNRFELNFQPIYGKGQRLSGFEALLRLPDERGNYISPGVFIPLAEEMGLIRGIGAWVIRRACEIAATWPSGLSVAVNLSPAQFRGFDAASSISRTVKAALAQSGLAPSRLELEITEGLLLESSSHVLEELRTIQELGVAIVMDDFGTGHSSLSYFWKLPFDKIKIDRSFISAPAEARPTIAPILDTIVALGRTLRMKITAEGIETAEQAAFCAKLDCDYLQGFYYGRPAAEAEVAAIILREFAGRVPEPAAQPAVA